MLKTTIIGAGSTVWGPAVTMDILLNPGFAGTELCLMDISEDSLQLVSTFARKFQADRDIPITITATTDVSEAVRDAKYVMSAISVGGDHLWRYDAMFPQIYGIYQSVGDTTGPGGLVRALRHAPPLIKIARLMDELGPAEATLIQLTNPMNALCGALKEMTSVRILGVCHGVDDTERIFAQALSIAQDEVTIEAAGNNHNIYCSRITIQGKTYEHEDFPAIPREILEGPFRREVFQRYGEIVCNAPRHPIEFIPGFLTPEHGFGQAWEIEPIAVEIDPAQPPRQERSREYLETAINQPGPLPLRENRSVASLIVRDDGVAEGGHSRETLDELILALEGQTELHTHLNIANDSSIPGVDAEANVELPVLIANGRIERKPVHLKNPEILELIARIAKEQHLIALSCLNYDEERLIEALSMDPLVSDKATAARLVREMTAYQHELIVA